MNTFSVAIASLLLLTSGGSLAMAAQTLPGGATSLSEKHDDWTVRCGIQNQSVACAARQQQVDPQSRRRTIALEVRLDKDTLTGSILMPFGLDLSKGVTLGVDAAAAATPLPFQTCVPGGCLAPFSLGADWVKALRSGSTLTVKSVAVNGAEAKFTLSLKGLGGSLDRIAELTK